MIPTISSASIGFLWMDLSVFPNTKAEKPSLPEHQWKRVIAHHLFAGESDCPLAEATSSSDDKKAEGVCEKVADEYKNQVNSVMHHIV